MITIFSERSVDIASRVTKIAAYLPITLTKILILRFIIVLLLTPLGPSSIATAEPNCSGEVRLDGVKVFSSSECCSEKAIFTECGECVESGSAQSLFRDCRWQCVTELERYQVKLDAECQASCQPPTSPAFEQYLCQNGEVKCGVAGDMPQK